MSMLHALVLAACEVNIFDLTDGLSRSTTYGQTDCLVHAVVDYFWIFSTMLLMLLLSNFCSLSSLCSSFSVPRHYSFALLLAVSSVHQLQYYVTHADAPSQAVVSLCICLCLQQHHALPQVLHLLNLHSPLLQFLELFYADYSKAYQNCPMN